MTCFMMRLLIISTSHGSCNLSGIEHDRHSGRALAFNEKAASSSPHVADIKEDMLATKEATALHY